MKSYDIGLSSVELTALFLFLQRREEELDSIQEGVLDRLRELIYQELSIDEMERLGELYSQKIDVLGQKG